MSFAGKTVKLVSLILILAILPVAHVRGGTVVAWGSNSQGQSTIPPNLTNVIGIAGATTLTAVIKSDGTVVAWGENYQSQTNIPAGLSNVVTISAGGYHGLALKNDGKVVAWGDNGTQQSLVPATLGPAIWISAGGGTGGGSGHSLVLQNDGTVVGFGSWVNGSGQATYQATPPSNLTNVIAVAAGQFHSLALKSDGTVVGWGSNTAGQTNVPAGLSNVVAIAAGGNTSLALKHDGTLVGWGISPNIPTGLSNVVAIAAGLSHRMALRSDGTVVAWGVGSQTNVPVGLSNVVAIAAGGNHSLVIVDDGPVSITRQPVPSGALLGGSSVFNVQALGLPQLTYQWRFNETNLLDATNSWLLLTNLEIENEGNYDVIVSDSVNTVTSSNAFLDIVLDMTEALNATNLTWTTSSNAPWIFQTATTHDGIAAARSGGVACGQESSLQTTVTGPGTFSFWWGAINSSAGTFSVNGISQASFPSSQWVQRTIYLAEGTNTLTWVANNPCVTPVTIGWVDQVSYIPGTSTAIVLAQPTDRSVPAGTNVTFFVTAGGTPTVTYQWRFNETNIAGATGASLTLNNVQTNNTGIYSVTVSNAYGGEISSNATLTVNPSSPWITTNPVTREMVRGGQVTFAVAARGSEPLKYQWKFNGADLVKETNSTLTLNHVQTNDQGGYRVAVSNAYGGVISSNAELRIVPMVIIGWGSTAFGKITIPAGLTNITAIAAGQQVSIASRRNGPVADWGFPLTDFPSGLTNVVALAAGSSHGIALGANGVVTGTGFGSEAMPPPLPDAVSVAAGSSHSLAAKSDGTVVVWGSTNFGRGAIPADLTNAVAVAAGWIHDMALRANGDVVAWGENGFGQTNVPAGLADVIALEAGMYHSLALKRDGTVVAWGRNLSGQTNVPPALSNVVAIAGGMDCTIALKHDGTVVAWGGNSSGETNVPAWLTNVIAIASGQNHNLALLNDGSPVALRPLASETKSAGDTIILNSSVVGAGLVNYQWQRDGTNIAGATNALLVFTATPLTASGNYSVVASNAFGMITNAGAILTIRQPLRFDVSEVTTEGFSIELVGLTGQGNIIIHASSNLIDWRPIFTNPPVVGTLYFVDPIMTNRPAGFYRAEEK